MAATPRKWLFYALGGGLGHLTRALALARAAARPAEGHAPADCTIVTNSPWAAAIERFLAREPVRWAVIPAERDRRAVAARLDTILARHWDLLVVDTFPRGLGGELAHRLRPLGCPRVFVHRDLDPRYVAARDLRRFVADHYDLALAPGDDGPLADLSICQRTRPWLVRDAHELSSRDAARAAFGVPPSDALVVVSAAGRPEEQDEMRALAGRLAAPRRRVEICSPGHGGYFPLLERLAGVDVVVGGGGYQTVMETRATNTPLVGLALRRRYDRQARRLGGAAVAPDAALVRDAVDAALAQPRPRNRPYVNGVHEALAAIVRRFGR